MTSPDFSRCALHKTKLEEFKEWLNDQGIAHRPGKGDYQVLQVLTDSHGWQVVFAKNEMPEHFTVNKALMPLLSQFFARKKGEEE